jgi:type IV pilus assembly protein PilV
MPEYVVSKMNSIKRLKNSRGATLVEAMIAIMLLGIGIIAVVAMQIRAMDASTKAMSRTDANAIATSFLEILKEMPFTDVNLVSTGNDLLSSAANPAGVVSTQTTGYLANNFNGNPQQQQIQTFIHQPNGAPAGEIYDNSGHLYTLTYAVQDYTLTETGGTPTKLITVYMTWKTNMGQNSLQMSTIKPNNT